MATLSAEVAVTELGPIEVATCGAGPTVVVLHGMPGSWRQAETVGVDVADGFRVVLPSRPGYGRTPLRSGRTPQEQAALLAALVAERGWGPAAVIGISGGGPAALAFAAQHREMCSALVLACAVAGDIVDVPRPMRVGAAIPPLAGLFAELNRRKHRRLGLDEARFAALLDAELTPDERRRAAAPEVDDAVRAFVASHAVAPRGTAGFNNDVRQLVRWRTQPTARPDLGRLAGLPTLIAHGTADAVVPFAHAEHHARVINGARLVSFDDAGHLFLATRRREATDLIRTHLQQM